MSRLVDYFTYLQKVEATACVVFKASAEYMINRIGLKQTVPLQLANVVDNFF